MWNIESRVRFLLQNLVKKKKYSIDFYKKNLIICTKLQILNFCCRSRIYDFIYGIYSIYISITCKLRYIFSYIKHIC